jgi:hypothetical protein
MRGLTGSVLNFTLSNSPDCKRQLSRRHVLAGSASRPIDELLLLNDSVY